MATLKDVSETGGDDQPAGQTSWEDLTCHDSRGGFCKAGEEGEGGGASVI